LQKFVGILEEILELVALRAQHLRRELRRHFYSSNRRILRNVADLVYFDAGFAAKSGLQLLRKRRGFRVSAGKSANELRQLRLR
jgi:hypothetical protein